MSQGKVQSRGRRHQQRTRGDLTGTPEPARPIGGRSVATGVQPLGGSLALRAPPGQGRISGAGFTPTEPRTVPQSSFLVGSNQPEQECLHRHVEFRPYDTIPGIPGNLFAEEKERPLERTNGTQTENSPSSLFLRSDCRQSLPASPFAVYHGAPIPLGTPTVPRRRSFPLL